MKTYTRRAAGADTLADAEVLQRTINRLRRSPLIARGLFRFDSHEEADAWMIRQLASTHARLSSKT